MHMSDLIASEIQLATNRHYANVEYWHIRSYLLRVDIAIQIVPVNE